MIKPSLLPDARLIFGLYFIAGKAFFYHNPAITGSWSQYNISCGGEGVEAQPSSISFSCFFFL
jgi:hypothetical protein